MQRLFFYLILCIFGFSCGNHISRYDIVRRENRVLLDNISSKDLALRIKAFSVLSERTSSYPKNYDDIILMDIASSQVVKGLCDDNDEIHTLAIEMLRNYVLFSPQTVIELFDNYGDVDVSHRLIYIDLIALSSKRGGGPLIPYIILCDIALKASTADEKVKAIDSVGYYKMNREYCLPVLSTIIKDNNESTEVRVAALNAILKYNNLNEEYIKSLEILIDDENKDFVNEVLKGLDIAKSPIGDYSK